MSNLSPTPAKVNNPANANPARTPLLFPGLAPISTEYVTNCLRYDDAQKRLLPCDLRDFDINTGEKIYENYPENNTITNISLSKQLDIIHKDENIEVNIKINDYNITEKLCNKFIDQDIIPFLFFSIENTNFDPTNIKYLIIYKSIKYEVICTKIICNDLVIFLPILLIPFKDKNTKIDRYYELSFTFKNCIYIIYYPRVISNKNKTTYRPSFLAPRKQYPLLLYIYIVKIYTENIDICMRKAVLKLNENLGLTMAHTTLSRYLKKIFHTDLNIDRDLLHKQILNMTDFSGERMCHVWTQNKYTTKLRYAYIIFCLYTFYLIFFDMNISSFLQTIRQYYVKLADEIFFIFVFTCTIVPGYPP
jgi:hypothetical protein